MTEDEHDLIRRLSRCIFVPWSSDRQFVRSLLVYDAADSLSEDQYARLMVMEHKYHRQLAHRRLWEQRQLGYDHS